jgi:hypothetical protein
MSKLTISLKKFKNKGGVLFKIDLFEVVKLKLIVGKRSSFFDDDDVLRDRHNLIDLGLDEADDVDFAKVDLKIDRIFDKYLIDL